MSTWNNDEVEGKFDQAKGSVKSTIGEITGDRQTEAEGDAEHAAGKTQETWGKVKHGVGDAVDASATRSAMPTTKSTKRNERKAAYKKLHENNFYSPLFCV